MPGRDLEWNKPIFLSKPSAPKPVISDSDYNLLLDNLLPKPDNTSTSEPQTASSALSASMSPTLTPNPYDK